MHEMCRVIQMLKQTAIEIKDLVHKFHFVL